MAEASHDERIRRVILAADLRHGLPEVPVAATPLSALIAGEDGSDPADERRRVRVETLQAMLSFFFERGAHPADVLKQVYAVVHGLRPDLLGNMTCAQVAMLFGETRAAHSWRVKQIFTTYCEMRTGGAAVLPWQKSPSARAAYARAQQGNTNRRRGARRKG